MIIQTSKVKALVRELGFQSTPEAIQAINYFLERSLRKRLKDMPPVKRLRASDVHFILGKHPFQLKKGTEDYE